ncbi:methionine--tRNA ligase [candidate division WWE3 bacterium]|uniref:Methionine--tRNA ligase n=1 Tax=candidate division WWE3 bacterium TaxID=2053526 RepID=A0A955J1Y6_UNCKA|nr:methionine--tRNA ligase [candidate division WWE3 bacterium]
MSKKVLIALAWPYVNGNLHVGHLGGYLIPADICARYNRLAGNKVLMVSGSDCHGTPITLEADKRGVTPADIVNEYHARCNELFFDVLGLSYDLYTRTDTSHHAQVTQEMFLGLLKNGYITTQTSQQYYDPTSNKFLPDRYVVGKCSFCGFNDSRSDQCDNCGKLHTSDTLLEPKSNLTGAQVSLKDTEHYFIDWPKLQDKIAKFVNESNNNNVWRHWVFQETVGWLNEGLLPRAITRDIDWGVPIPVDQIPEDLKIDNLENKRFYVWFDAVIGYLSASKLWAKDVANDPNAWKEFWAQDSEVKHYYFMGKDNLPFHTLFWPGQLIGFDDSLHLPDFPCINHFVNFNNAQLSKSRGNIVDSRQMVADFGNDATRFYLTLIGPETRDANFTWEDFAEKVNGILVANVGNFINRVLSLGTGFDVANFNLTDLDPKVVSSINEAFDSAHSFLEKCEYRNYLNTVLELSTVGNHYLDACELWKLKDEPKEFSKHLLNSLAISYAVATLLEPVTFEATAKFYAHVNIEKPSVWPVSDVANTLAALALHSDLSNKPTPLFNKVELPSK